MTDKEKDFNLTDFELEIIKEMIEGEKRPPHPDKTDLEAIKEVMKSMLDWEINVSTVNGVNIVHHPFLDNEVQTLLKEGFSYESYSPGEPSPFEYIFILEDPEGLKKVKKIIQEDIDEADSIDSLYLSIKKGYLFCFLEMVEQLLSCDDLSRMLKDIWTDVECANYNNPLSIETLVGIFHSCNPEVLMGEDDYRYYQELPDELTIYRGTIDNDEDSINSMSWTLSKDVGIWFAKRFRGVLGDGFAYKAKISKPDVLAYFSDRKESTVVVNPYGLRDIEEIESV